MDVTLFEVGLGLAVIFLIVATIVDGINEFITRTLNVRTKALWATISGLVQHRRQDLPHVGLPFMVQALRPGVHRPKRSDSSKEGDLLSTPSIRALDYQRKAHKRTKASHIPGSVFASALLEVANTKGAGGSLEEKITTLTKEYEGTLLGQYLATFSGTAATEIDKFLDVVGNWFDAEMSRLQSTYRRNVKYALGLLGFLAALALNIDAIRITETLHQNASLSEAVAIVGDDISQGDFADCSTEGVDPLECVSGQISLIEGLDIPVIGTLDSETWVDAWGPPLSWERVSHILGLGITGAAVSLGGVFWWDLLRWISGRRRTTS